MFDCNKDPKIGTYGIGIGVKTVSKGNKRKIHEDYPCGGKEKHKNVNSKYFLLVKISV